MPWRRVIPVAAFLLLTALGITQSSIGIDVLREHPDDPHGLMLGEARKIRSDEFITSTPTFLGAAATGSPKTLNPLAAQQGVFSGLPRGPVSSVVLLDSAALDLGPWLPDASLVALKWWLPFLLLLLAAPAWFRRITGSASIGWWAAALIILSPSSVWWSFIHVQILGFGFAAMVALQCAIGAARERRWPVAVGWVAACAVLLTRTAFTYQPWVIVLIPPLLLVTVVHLLGPRATRKVSALTTAAAGLASVLVLALVLAENRAEIAAITGTIYPGQRRSTGSPNALQEIFGATSLGTLGHGARLVGTNASEISSSYAVIWAWVVALVAAGLRCGRAGQRWTWGIFAAVSAFWVAWSTVSFGALGTHLPLADLVPSYRSAEVLGYLAIVMVCLVLPQVQDSPRRSAAVVPAVVVVVLAAYAGSELRSTNLPGLSLTVLWGSSLVAGLVVWIVTAWPRRWPGYALGVLAAAALVWNVNPVLVGAGDLRGTEVADYFQAVGDRARADGEVFATDDYSTDALMLATGVPAVSGRQVSGPDEAAWRAFLPKAPERVWNRGAAFIWFQWTADPRLVVRNPTDDVILISGSPCDVSRRLPEVRQIVSNHELGEACLSLEHRFDWGGRPRWSYEVVPVPGDR